MSARRQQPTFDISSRSHIGTTSRTPYLTGLLYSLDKRRSPLTIEDGAPRPVGTDLRRERATRGQPVALPIYAFPSQGTSAAYCRFLRAVGVEVDEGSAGQARAFRPPNNARLFRLPLLPPHCRFAGRLFVRTSGILALVWSPDAVNDAGGIDDCAVTVAPTSV